MARLHEIPEPNYTPPLSEEELEAIRKQQLEEAEMRAAEVLLDGLGRELCDPTPMEPPIGYNPQPTLVEQMRAMIQGERLRMAALEGGFETFEEADDFDMDEDPFPRSIHEVDEFSTPVRELKERQRRADAPPPEQNQQSAGATSAGTATERPANSVGRKSGAEGSTQTASPPPSSSSS